MSKYLCKLAISIAFLVTFSSTPAFQIPDIDLPEGFTIKVLTDQVPGARSMALGDKGTLFVSTMGKGKVYAVSGIELYFLEEK